jgi:hypothetical protein
MRARRYRGEYREVAGAIAMRSKLTTLELASSPQLPFWLAYTTNTYGSNFRKGQLPDQIGFVLEFAVGMRFPTLTIVFVA